MFWMKKLAVCLSQERIGSWLIAYQIKANANLNLTLSYSSLSSLNIKPSSTFLTLNFN